MRITNFLSIRLIAFIILIGNLLVSCVSNAEIMSTSTPFSTASANFTKTPIYVSKCPSIVLTSYDPNIFYLGETPSHISDKGFPLRSSKMLQELKNKRLAFFENALELSVNLDGIALTDSQQFDRYNIDLVVTVKITNVSNGEINIFEPWKGSLGWFGSPLQLYNISNGTRECMQTLETREKWRQW